MAVEARVRGEAYDPPALEGLEEPRAVFVTLTRADGSLRGCIGHLRPVRAHLAAEVADVAGAAAVNDSRFRPVDEDELSGLLKICKRQLYNMRMRGEIPYLKLGRSVRFRVGNVVEALERLRIG